MGRGPRQFENLGVGSHREATGEPAGLTGNVATARRSVSSCGPAVLAPALPTAIPMDPSSAVVDVQHDLSVVVWRTAEHAW